MTDERNPTAPDARDCVQIADAIFQTFKVEASLSQMVEALPPRHRARHEFAMLQQTDRVEFIRRAAIAVWHKAEDPSQVAACWEVARALWDAKPEDC